jgi:hypothetical protein
LTEAEKAALAEEEERLFREARLALDDEAETPVLGETTVTDGIDGGEGGAEGDDDGWT